MPQRIHLILSLSKDALWVCSGKPSAMGPRFRAGLSGEAEAVEKVSYGDSFFGVMAGLDPAIHALQRVG